MLFYAAAILQPQQRREGQQYVIENLSMWKADSASDENV
jgi:hypothetical protein